MLCNGVVTGPGLSDNYFTGSTHGHKVIGTVGGTDGESFVFASSETGKGDRKGTFRLSPEDWEAWVKIEAKFSQNSQSVSRNQNVPFRFPHPEDNCQAKWT